jgi:hypothetical protein
MSAVKGHRDNYNGQANQCTDEFSIESKYVITLGKGSVVIGESPFCSSKSKPVPAGCLVYPKYKIYTHCLALNDLEYHYLTDIVHLVGRNTDLMYRGCIVPLPENTVATTVVHFKNAAAITGHH